MKNIPAILCLCLLTGVSGCQSQKPDVVKSAASSFTASEWRMLAENIEYFNSMEDTIDRVSNLAKSSTGIVYRFQNTVGDKEVQRAVAYYYATYADFLIATIDVQEKYGIFMSIIGSFYDGYSAQSLEQIMGFAKQMQDDINSWRSMSAMLVTKEYSVINLMKKYEF